MSLKRLRSTDSCLLYALIPFAVVTLIAAATAWGANARKPSRYDDDGSARVASGLASYVSSGSPLEPRIPDEAFELALNDEDDRVSPLFAIPPGLRGATGFWLKIYTLYTSQHVVIFDSRHPEIVYEALDFRELHKKSRNLVAYEIVSRARVKAAVRKYREALVSLARNPRPRKPTEAQRRVMAAIARADHRHSYAEYARYLRSQTGQRDHVIRGISAAERFFPQMDRIFASHGVPTEITRLALVESSFNMKAVSRVGATGVWQFMFRSGQEFMIVDPGAGIDERLSPLKSTVAAAKLLRRNAKILGNWPLAITSYNHGLRSFIRLPRHRRQESNVAELFRSCLKAPSHAPASVKRGGKGSNFMLGYASRNYYAEFLALLHAESYRNLFYGYVDPPEGDRRRVIFEKLRNPGSAFQFAVERGIPIHDFRFYNPDIRNLYITLPRGFWLAVPIVDGSTPGPLEDHDGISAMAKTTRHSLKPWRNRRT